VDDDRLRGLQVRRADPGVSSSRYGPTSSTEDRRFSSAPGKRLVEGRRLEEATHWALLGPASFSPAHDPPEEVQDVLPVSELGLVVGL
jgi:hypothetical protein